MYFNVNFNVFFKLIEVHLLVSELHIILVRFSTKLEFSQQIFEKKFSNIKLGPGLFHTNGCTDRWTNRHEGNSRFS
jgi:hypothetical protein